jgi:hypothetical protein
MHRGFPTGPVRRLACTVRRPRLEVHLLAMSGAAASLYRVLPSLRGAPATPRKRAVRADRCSRQREKPAVQARTRGVQRDVACRRERARRRQADGCTSDGWKRAVQATECDVQPDRRASHDEEREVQADGRTSLKDRALW